MKTMDIYKKYNTYLAIEVSTNEPLRWADDNKLFFAGSIDDALEFINRNDVIALQVSKCSKELQIEYEQLIDEKIKNGEIKA